jgi:Tol biopolymer transport system component
MCKIQTLRKLGTWGLSVLALFAISCSPSLGPNVATQPVGVSDLPEIAFLKNWDDDIQLHAITADGSRTTKLSNLPGNKGSFAFSPDGRWLAFSAQVNESFDVYLMSTDDSRITSLSRALQTTREPFITWAPDGQSLAIGSINERDSTIRILSLDGTEISVFHLQNLLLWSPGPSLAWSPDGGYIAFAALDGILARGPATSIYIINRDGSEFRTLTGETRADNELAWSPDGSKLYFRSSRDGNWEIYAMGRDGAGQINLTNSPADEELPNPSPDGRTIAFLSDGDHGNRDLFFMNSDGTEQTNVSHGLGDVTAVSWAPNGKWLVFAASERAGPGRYIYVADSTGKLIYQLTSGPGFDAHPVWMPYRR